MKDFDSWNNLKKKIDFAKNSSVDKFPKESEVWMSVFGKNIGFEQDGSGNEFLRPVLIIKKFNNQMFWAVPLSTKQKSLDYYFDYSDPDELKVSAILAQMRLLSVKRIGRKLYEMKPDNFIEIKKILKSFL